MLISWITAGIMGLLLLVLSMRVSLRRRVAKVSLGEGDDAILRGRIRAQANLTEYLPTILLLLFLAEQGYGRVWFIAMIAALFVAARLLHAFGVARPAPNAARLWGALGTYLVLLLLALLLLGRAATL